MNLKKLLFMDKPIKVRLLIFFIPLIILSVVLSGFFSQLLSSNQIKENTYHLLIDTVQQTSVFINDKLMSVFEELLVLEGHQTILNNALKVNEHNDLAGLQDMIQFKNKLRETQSKSMQLIDSIYVKLNNGREYYMRDVSNIKNVSLDLDEWVEAYSWSDKGYYWLNSHTDHIFETIEQRDVLSVFKILGKRDAQFNGILLINLRTAYFRDILQNLKISSNGNIMIISPDGMLYSKDVNSKYEIGEAGIKHLRDNMGGSGSFNIISKGKESMLVVYSSIDINDWIVAVIVPESDMLETASQITYIFIGIILLLLFLSIIVSTIFAKSISHSITYLSERVKLVERGNFNIEFNVKDRNEIGVLANGLTSLVKTIRNLLVQVREEADKKRKMELLVLQSQINPHFLYNTLTSIQQLIVQHDNENARTMLKAITVFFQIAVSRGKEIIHVHEEVNHIEQYLIIQKMRYSEDFDFVLDISEELLDCYMIKLLLQPIVENSIYHGIKNKYDRGQIRISGKAMGDKILFEIMDDGAGIPEERLIELNYSIDQPEIDEYPITFGLRNVNQRIKLYYGQEYGILIESVLHEYTRVVMTIPLLTELSKEVSYD